MKEMKMWLSVLLAVIVQTSTEKTKTDIVCEEQC